MRTPRPAGRPRVTGFAALAALLAWTAGSVSAAPKPLDFTEPKRVEPVSFQREVLPRLQSSCLPCHNQTRAKAGLNLETPEWMRKGGDSGTALVPGKPEESLVLRTAAHRVEDLVMPPADNKANARDLSAEELGLLSLWIRQGGKADAVADDAPAWKPIDPGWRSSFAVAVAPDDRSVAVARANRVDLHDLASGRRTGDLADPALGGAAQRDVVGALAFSPDGSTLAAAGFREVRLWRREPAQVTPRPVVMTNGTPAAAAFSPDRTRIAWVTRTGHLEIRAASALGPAFVHRDLVAAGDPGPVPLAWSPDGRWLAVGLGGLGGTSGVVRLFPPDSATPGPSHPVAHGVAALAWWDGGRRLAVAPRGAHPLADLPAPPAAASAWAGATNLGGSPATVTARAASGGDGAVLLAALADGTLRRWNATEPGRPADLPGRGAVVSLHPSGSGARFLASFAAGGFAGVEPGAKEPWGKAGSVPLDPAAGVRRARAKEALELARMELARAGVLRSEGGAARKAADEQLAKVRTRREADAKALDDLGRQRTEQLGVEAAATKERDEAGAALEKATQAEKAADQARTEALSAVAKAADRHAAAAAELAVARKEPPPQPASTAPAAPAGAAADTARLAEPGRQAEAAAAERARAVAALDAAAFAAGQRRAEADRARADLPPRRKQAEERLAAAKKAVSDLDGRIAKARTALDGSTQDVALGEKAVAKADAGIAGAGRAEEEAKSRIAEAETALKAAETSVKAALARTAAAAAWAPDGSGALVADADGRVLYWATGDAETDAPVETGLTRPLAVAAVDAGRFLVFTAEGMVRVEPNRPWRLWRTIGSASPGPDRPFVDRVNALAFSPDGRLLATGGGDPSRSGELKVWNAEGGTLVRDLGAVHSDTVTAVAFSPRGDRLLTGGSDRFARITPVEGDGPRLALEGHTHHVLAVAWDPDGGTVASAGADGVVKLWNAVTGERRKNVEGFGKEVTGLLAAGTTPRFVAVGGDGRGRVFRADGEGIRDLAAVPEYLQAVAATRDGLRAVGTDDRGVLCVWNLDDGTVRRDVGPKGEPSGF